MKAPLIIGCDVTALDPQSATFQTLSNPEVIAVNQDPLGAQARRVWSQGSPVEGEGANPTMLAAERARRRRRTSSSDSSSGSGLGILDYDDVVVDLCAQPGDAAAPFQTWAFTSNNTVTEAGDGRCLDIMHCESGLVLPNPVSAYPCTVPSGSQCDSLNQQWVYVPGNGSIVSGLAGQCLTVDPRNGFNVATMPCAGGQGLAPLQTWFFDAASGQARIRTPSNNRVAAVAAAASSSAPPLFMCLSVLRDVAPGAQEVWAGPLADGTVVVLLLNRSPSPANITANWADVGLFPAAPYVVRDLWQRRTVGTFTGSFTAQVVPSHGTVMLKMFQASE
jgi:hypothetical protein